LHEALPHITRGGDADQRSVELSARRTGMSFQRTRLSADRTLMSVIRTALSLIGFGFTIYQFFQHLVEVDVLSRARAPRSFGLGLVIIGVAMLLVGCAFHIQFMLGLRHTRNELMADGLIHGQSRFPVSYTLVIALLLLVLGVATLASMAFDIGPFE
jgi:putative membrane protein